MDLRNIFSKKLKTGAEGFESLTPFTVCSTVHKCRMTSFLFFLHNCCRCMTAIKVHTIPNGGAVEAGILRKEGRAG